ncbi:MAG: TlpA family protein disulfide reductase [Calditerrivibrio sp.]|nr:TlpA family protein disulfide reductase [Calditerrivibrio sp.]
MKKIFLTVLLLISVGLRAEVREIDGHNFSGLLLQGYNKTVVVFWAVYCPYCKALLKTLNENYEYFRTQKINIIAISTDKNPQLVDDFVRKNGFHFNVYIDKGDLKKKYNAYYIPMTVIFDKKGELEDTFPGNKSFDQLKEYLND